MNIYVIKKSRVSKVNIGIKVSAYHPVDHILLLQWYQFYNKFIEYVAILRIV